MLRRNLVSALLGGYVGARAATQDRLSLFMAGTSGRALLLDVRSRSLVASHGIVGRLAAPPGSTIKPFALAALLEAGKMSSEERFLCPGVLRIAGRSFNCSHPRTNAPLRVREALAYSCNCFTAHFAERFEPGELARYLMRAGLGSRTGLAGGEEASGQIRPAGSGEASQLQALGEEGVLATAAGLAMAFRFLALSAGQPAMRAVVGGLEDAVEYGTARAARTAGFQVAGKTGTARNGVGTQFAWFAGFAPSRAPEVVVAVALQGHSGGADAAPVAGRILEWYHGGRL